MKPLLSKKLDRFENKKKKLAALANWVQLNDEDRFKANNAGSKKNIEKLQQQNRQGGECMETDVADMNGNEQFNGGAIGTTMTTTTTSTSTNADDGFIMVSYKKKSSKVIAKPFEEVQAPPKKIRIMQRDSNTNRFNDLNNYDATLPLTEEEQQSQTSTDNDEKSNVNIDADADEDQTKVTLTDSQYKQVRRQLRERKRQLENVPSLRLHENGFRASLRTPMKERTPLFLTDIQHLLMSTLIGKNSPCTPERWCFLDKSIKLSHSVVLILEGLSLYHYLSYESKFENANKIFDTRLELVLPPTKEGCIVEQIAQVPLTNLQAQELIDRHGSLEAAIEMNKDPTLFVKAIFPIESESVQQQSCTVDATPSLPPSDKFPRTKLLLSALQMVDEGYPMPLRGELQERFKNYKFTKREYAAVSNYSPMFGVDCEMCRTSIGENELTRISIVNEELETVYETLVRPTNRIIDYLTRYSGITPEIMKTVTKTLKDVQREVSALLPPDAILVGQSLNIDLNAMHMMHPYVIDTSVIFNLSGFRRKKSKLQTLAKTFLKELIQDNEDGHDSVEDSLASLKLVKMKLANSLNFGDEILLQKRKYHDIIRCTTSDKIKNNLFAHVSQRNKRTALITTGSMEEPLRNILYKAADTGETASAKLQDELKAVTLFEFQSNKEAVKKAREVALEHQLTITNLQMDPERLYPTHIEETLNKIDKWINKLWKTMAHNGMLLVLMGGSVECPSGLAKIAIKRNLPEILNVNNKP